MNEWQKRRKWWKSADVIVNKRNEMKTRQTKWMSDKEEENDGKVRVFLMLRE